MLLKSIVLQGLAPLPRRSLMGKPWEWMLNYIWLSYQMWEGMGGAAGWNSQPQYEDDSIG